MTSSLTRLGSSWLLPTVLSTTAGAVDVIGFLALGGLFTSHITGNVVILAAHYVTGRFSQIGPLLAYRSSMGVVTLAASAIARPGTTRFDRCCCFKPHFSPGFWYSVSGLVDLPMRTVRWLSSPECLGSPPWQPKMCC